MRWVRELSVNDKDLCLVSVSGVERPDKSHRETRPEIRETNGGLVCARVCELGNPEKAAGGKVIVDFDGLSFMFQRSEHIFVLIF